MNSEIIHVDGKCKWILGLRSKTSHKSKISNLHQKPSSPSAIQQEWNLCFPSFVTFVRLANQQREKKRCYELEHDRAAVSWQNIFISIKMRTGRTQRAETTRSRQSADMIGQRTGKKQQNTRRLKYLKNNHMVWNIHSFPFTFALVVFLNKVRLT